MRRVLSALALCCAGLYSQDFDLLITNGRIVDGAGNPWFQADVGVRNGRISAIGRLAGRPSGRVIDAKGLVVAPGFIDMMGATSTPLLRQPASAESKLRQGITTMLAGEGSSAAPQNEHTWRGSRGPVGWRTFAEYFTLLESKGVALNVLHNVGAAQVRRVVIGDEDRKPSPEQLAKMRELVDEAMRDGAVGLSTALIYPPGTYADTHELTELAKVVARHGGIYLTHMRNESHRLPEAIEESISIGRAAGIPVHIFHLKAAGQENWPRIHRAIAAIEEARRSGQDVSSDIYPYVHNGIDLGSFLHPRHYAAGAPAFLATLKEPARRAELRKEVEETADWENWYRHVGKNWDRVLVAQTTDGNLAGKSISQIAKLRGQDEWNTFFDLVLAQTSVTPESMNEEQKHAALKAEWVSICTDAGPVLMNSGEGAHPRAFGAFPRVLAKYVREDKVISLEAAIRRMSSLAANRLRLYDRGRIAPGLWADIVIFDEKRVRDTATFALPRSFPEGIPYVIVNGAVAIDKGAFSGRLAGRVLRHHAALQ